MSDDAAPDLKHEAGSAQGLRRGGAGSLAADHSGALDYIAAAEGAAFARCSADADVSLPREVGIVGAGTMGTGIALCFAAAGVSVVLLDRAQDSLDRSLARIASTLSASTHKSRITPEEAEAQRALIRTALSYDALAGCDLVVEAAFENLEVKQDVFREVVSATRNDTLLWTNTSTIDIDSIARVLPEGRGLVGAHFFSPANVMRLLEIVQGQSSHPSDVARSMQLGRLIGKMPVWSGNCDGFVANRSRGVMMQQAAHLVEQGVLPQQIDQAMTAFGFAMGPFAAADLAGLDVGWAVRKRRQASDPSFRSQPVADRLCELGRFGQKTGAGWYRYEPGSRTPIPDPQVGEIIRDVAAKLKIAQRAIADEEIIPRLLYPVINEICLILDEGIARYASDVDLMWLYGFGFPRMRGGPMYWADQVGAQHVYDGLRRWENEPGMPPKPARLLELAARERLSLVEMGRFT